MHAHQECAFSVIDFPPPIEGEPVRISATLLTTYLRCAGEAEGRLNGVFAPDTVASFAGALLHRVLRRHLEEGVIPAQELPHVCRQEIGQGRLNAKMNAVGLSAPSRLEPLFAEIAEKYQRFQAYPQDGFHSAERLIEIEPAAGVTLVGKIDAVFDDADGLRLVDWKSGGLGSPRRQLGFYALLWTLETGEPPVEIEVVSLGTGERHSERVSVPWLEEVASSVSAFASAIRRMWATGDSLPLTAGPWCRYCPLHQECPEGRAALQLLDGGVTPRSIHEGVT